jgi:hypothetical protein
MSCMKEEVEAALASLGYIEDFGQGLLREYRT